MSFLASVFFACVSLFMALIVGYGIARLEDETDPKRRKHHSAAILLSALLSITLVVAALMVAVKAQ